MAGTSVHRVVIYPLVIPLRRRVEHAASRRGVADPIVVAVELTNGVTGFGETLPRAYVTGETVDTVLESIRGTFTHALLRLRIRSFPEALEAIEALPWCDGTGRGVPAARAAIELALVEAVLRTFRRSVDDVVRWMDLPGFGARGRPHGTRYSAVLATDSLEAMQRQLRFFYWTGFQDFKLKVGVKNDWERLQVVARYLQRARARGRATLRLDANGGWSPDVAEEWLDRAKRLPIEAIEQPLPKGREDELPRLRQNTNVPIFHDESLVTVGDARRLIELGVADGFNIRISKCGGLIPSLRLAALGLKSGVDIQLGCMVGETSILTAAGIRFLRVCPNVRWAEGAWGTYLLRRDVTERSLRMGYGGRPPALHGPVLGVNVKRLEELCEDAPIVIHL